MPAGPAVVAIENATFILLLEKNCDVIAYQQALERVAANAFDEHQSIRLISRVARSLDNGTTITSASSAE
jgi:hypothetical protein